MNKTSKINVDIWKATICKKDLLFLERVIIKRRDIRKINTKQRES